MTGFVFFCCFSWLPMSLPSSSHYIIILIHSKTKYQFTVTLSQLFNFIPFHFSSGIIGIYLIHQFLVNSGSDWVWWILLTTRHCLNPISNTNPFVLPYFAEFTGSVRLSINQHPLSDLILLIHIQSKNLTLFYILWETFIYFTAMKKLMPFSRTLV